ncbi:MAG: hypothetical protein ABIN96_16770 [Rubrivivax sp.]
MRRWLMLLLLCLTIPLQGMASASVRGQRCLCPMESAPAAAATSDAAEAHAASTADVTASDDADIDGCCNDADTAARTGQPCKVGQECHAPVLALAHAVAVSPAIGPLRPICPEVADCGPADPPDVVWRPPARIR